MSDDELRELLDLDATVLRAYWGTVFDEVQRAARDVHRVVDLGSGTGTGARGLAERFPAADVIAVDSSQDMIDRIRAYGGVTTVLADLDDGWPPITDVDITFASMSLHHLSDPQRVLRALFAATRPGGIVAAAEFTEPLRVLRDDYEAGIEARVMTMLRRGHAMPDLQVDWRSLVTGAGFDVVTDRTLHIDVPGPLDEDARRYAKLWLSRLQHAGVDRLGAGDLDALAAAVDDNDALHLHGSRTLVIGRRPR